MPVGKSWLDPVLKRFAPLRARIELLISGRPQDDPLYLSNRSWQQKARISALIALPALLVILLVTAAATDVFRLQNKVNPFEHPLKETQPTAVALKHVPDPVFAPTGLEVVSIRITKDAKEPVVTGIVRNNTDQKVASAQVSYYLADTDGSLVGTDTTEVTNVAAHGSTTFRMPLKAAKAEYVIVRDVHAQ